MRRTVMQSTPAGFAGAVLCRVKELCSIALLSMEGGI